MPTEPSRKTSVAIWKGNAEYPPSPFDPSELYPEYPFKRISRHPNHAYEGVRECLKMLGLDRPRCGTPEWNPLGSIVTPGQTVVLKPNFVLSYHAKGGSIESIITHPSVLRAVADYVYIALQGSGKIIIADAPQMDCNFEELATKTDLFAIQRIFLDEAGFDVQILDLRNFQLHMSAGDTVAYAERRAPLPGDPAGSVVINLGENSAFFGKENWHKFYGADYTRDETIALHHDNVHKYVISKTILEADVFISVPKLKVHKKVGVTLNGKGLVGITTNKNCLVHYTLGTPDQGGDQFPSDLLSNWETFLIRTQRFLYDHLLAKKNPIFDKIYKIIFSFYKNVVARTPVALSQDKKLMDAGNWHGNDSAWRMLVDLMYIITYADSSGNLRETPQRAMFSFVDGIIGGENDGPLAPDSVQSGVILAGSNLLAVDIAATRLMGLDHSKLKWIDHLKKAGAYGITDEQDIYVISNSSQHSNFFGSDTKIPAFKPHPGWQGFLELG